MTDDRATITEATPLKLGGAFGSPYSIKLRAVLRYRRLPYRWMPRDSAFDDLPEVPVRIMPALGFPGADGAYGEAMVDSTPIIARLEQMTSERSVVPVDPAVAFIDELLEDFGDEWVTKAMYHYRWFYEENIAKAGKLLPLELDLQMSEATYANAVPFITDRQISRRALVGSTEENRAVIERSYERVLDLMEAHLASYPYLCGARPGRGDFGIFGQLSQLVGWDPVSAAVAVDRAPRVVHWVMRTDDASWWPVSGHDGWFDRETLPRSTRALLAEVGTVYAPFLLANAAAAEAGDEMFSLTLPDGPYSQGTFKYQVKCLGWLREHYTALAEGDRRAVDELLEGTGCEALFS